MFSKQNQISSVVEQSSVAFLQERAIKGEIVYNPGNQSLQVLPIFPGSQDDDSVTTDRESE